MAATIESITAQIEELRNIGKQADEVAGRLNELEDKADALSVLAKNATSEFIRDPNTTDEQRAELGKVVMSYLKETMKATLARVAAQNEKLSARDSFTSAAKLTGVN